MGKKSSGSKKTAKKKKSSAPMKKPSPATPAAPKPAPTPAGEIASAMRMHVWQIQPLRDVLFVLAVVAVFWMGYVLGAVTVPLLVALMLAYLFEPIIDRLCKHPQITRVRAVTGLLVTVGLGVLLVLAIVIPLIVSQTIQLARYVTDGELRDRATSASESLLRPSWQEYTLPIIELLPQRSGDKSTPDATEIPPPDDAPPSLAANDPRTAGDLSEEELASFIEEHVAAVMSAQAASDEDEDSWASLTRGYNALREGMGIVFGLLGRVVQLGLVAFLIPFYFFFFSLWYPAVVRFGRSLVPEKNKVRTIELLKKMDYVVAGFVRGRIVISLIMGLMLAIGWKFCGVPYAFALGFVTGIFCAVPYLGVVGLPMAIIFLFFEQANVPHESSLWWLWVLVWPSAVFTVVQLIEGYALTPMIAGKVTNLDPVTIIVAVLAGGSVLGIYGMLLSIPAAACGKILFTEVLLPRIRQWTEGKVSDPLPIGGD